MSLDSSQAAIMIQAMAIQAEIEGMKAANQMWPQGSTPEFDQNAFYQKAMELTQLARDMRNN